MMPGLTPSVLDRVRQALGRGSTSTEAPIPPAIEEPIVRLVYSDIGLSELFQTRAKAMKMLVEPVRVDEVLDRLVEFLRERKCQSVMLSQTPLLEKLDAVNYLSRQGFNARSWSDLS